MNPSCCLSIAVHRALDRAEGVPGEANAQDSQPKQAKGSIYGLCHLLFQALGSVEESTKDFLDVRKMLRVLKVVSSQVRFFSV